MLFSGVRLETPFVPMTSIWKLPTVTSLAHGSPPEKDTKFR